jgi:hypothetical protein
VSHGARLPAPSLWPYGLRRQLPLCDLSWFTADASDGWVGAWGCGAPPVGEAPWLAHSSHPGGHGTNAAWWSGAQPLALSPLFHSVATWAVQATFSSSCFGLQVVARTGRKKASKDSPAVPDSMQSAIVREVGTGALSVMWTQSWCCFWPLLNSS